MSESMKESMKEKAVTKCSLNWLCKNTYGKVCRATRGLIFFKSLVYFSACL